MVGKSKNIYINQEIWSQPWFIDLNAEQKLAYLYVHTNCNQIGVYLHTNKLTELHINQSIEDESLLDWFNQQSERIIKLEKNTFLLTKFLEEENKRGTKIKPTSNVDLGKVREAINCRLLDKLIELESFHSECKIFEFGINEGIIKNKSYSNQLKKDQTISDYDKMIATIQQHPKYSQALGKPSSSLSSNTLNNNIAYREGVSNTDSASESDKLESDYYLAKSISNRLNKRSFKDHELVQKVNELSKKIEAKGYTGNPFDKIEYALSEMEEHRSPSDLTVENLTEMLVGNNG